MISLNLETCKWIYTLMKCIFCLHTDSAKPVQRYTNSSFIRYIQPYRVENIFPMASRQQLQSGQRLFGHVNAFDSLQLQKRTLPSPTHKIY